jgi:hypothetical protein
MVFKVGILNYEAFLGYYLCVLSIAVVMKGDDLLV